MNFVQCDLFGPGPMFKNPSDRLYSLYLRRRALFNLLLFFVLRLVFFGHLRLRTIAHPGGGKHGSPLTGLA